MGAECPHTRQRKRVDFVGSMDRWSSRDEAQWPGQQTLAAYIGDLTKELSKMARSAHYDAKDREFADLLAFLRERK